MELVVTPTISMLQATSRMNDSKPVEDVALGRVVLVLLTKFKRPGFPRPEEPWIRV